MRGEVCWSLRKGVERADEGPSSGLLESQPGQFSSERRRTAAGCNEWMNYGSWTFLLIAAVVIDEGG